MDTKIDTIDYYKFGIESMPELQNQPDLIKKLKEYLEYCIIKERKEFADITEEQKMLQESLTEKLEDLKFKSSVLSLLSRILEKI